MSTAGLQEGVYRGLRQGRLISELLGSRSGSGTAAGPERAGPRLAAPESPGR